MSPAEAELMMRYIPPPGAMQFELGEEYKSVRMWVQPGVAIIERLRNLKTCKCKHGFSVVKFLENAPADMQANFELARREGVPCMVCACLGKIVE